MRQQIFTQQRYKCAAQQACKAHGLLVSYTASPRSSMAGKDATRTPFTLSTRQEDLEYRATLYYTRVFTFCARLSAARAA